MGDHPLGECFVLLLAPHRARCRKGERLYIGVDEREGHDGTRLVVTRRLGGSPDRHASAVLDDREMDLGWKSKGALVDYVAGVIRYLIGLVTERYVAFRLRRGPHWGRERMATPRAFRSRLRTRGKR